MRKADKAAQKENEAEQAKTQNDAQDKKEEASDHPRENFFKSFFDVGTKYYKGGFDDKMTKREAALILGVQESASKQRIRDAHRKLLILNHSDTVDVNLYPSYCALNTTIRDFLNQAVTV